MTHDLYCTHCYVSLDRNGDLIKLRGLGWGNGGGGMGVGVGGGVGIKDARQERSYMFLRLSLFV